MFIFPWMDKYSVHVESIDAQHQKLVELLNNLASAMSSGKGNLVLETTLNELIDYTVYHFGDEEIYFSRINYPQAEDHLLEHRKLIEKVSQFKLDFEAKKIGLSIELMRFLKEWLINHISGTDKQLGMMLNKAGIK